MLIGAIKNEIEKLFLKKRIHIVCGIVIFFAILTSSIDFFDPQSKDTHWKENTEAQIQQIEKNLGQIGDKSSDEYKNLTHERQNLEYHLKENINPDLINAAVVATDSVSGTFIKIVLPLLIIIITADIITNESSNGTLKTLLASPMGRKNIILSKWIAASLISIGIMLFSDILGYITAIPFYGLGNWNDLLVIDFGHLRSVPMWAYLLIGLFLNCIMIITLVSVCILISVFFNTVTTSVSLSMAMVILGAILGGFQYKVDVLKYVFLLNFDIMSFITGDSTIQNSSITISFVTMVLTSILTLGIALKIFTKKDMLV